MYTRKRRTLQFTALQLLGLHARGWVRRSDKRRQNQHLDSPRRSTDEIEKGRDAARNAQAIYMNCTPVQVSVVQSKPLRAARCGATACCILTDSAPHQRCNDVDDRPEIAQRTLKFALVDATRTADGCSQVCVLQPDAYELKATRRARAAWLAAQLHESIEVCITYNSLTAV